MHRAENETFQVPQVETKIQQSKQNLQKKELHLSSNALIRTALLTRVLNK